MKEIVKIKYFSRKKIDDIWCKLKRKKVPLTKLNLVFFSSALKPLVSVLYMTTFCVVNISIYVLFSYIPLTTPSTHTMKELPLLETQRPNLKNLSHIWFHIKLLRMKPALHWNPFLVDLRRGSNALNSDSYALRLINNMMS